MILNETPGIGLGSKIILCEIACMYNVVEYMLVTYMHVHCNTCAMNIHVKLVYIFVGRCLATKVFFRQIAGNVMGVDDHRVGL